jgi:hypothetical protein
MTGGGLLVLVAYGNANVILSGNPDFTYFYKTFKKYTHFSLETVSKLMDGPTDYPYDTTLQLRARVDRVAELVSDMYFSFQIPAIYSKFHNTDVTIGPKTQDEFQWVRYVGAAAIQTVSINVGPNKIQEFTGEYLMSKAMIDYPNSKFEKWRRLVGDVPEIYDPANGLYGNPTATSGVYPTVYPDSRNPSAAQTNTPSIPSYTVYVPLPFWFTEEGQALPLVGLQYYTVDVNITLNPSRTLYTTLDLSGNRMAPGYRILSATSLIQRNIPDFANVSDTEQQIKQFLVDIGYTVPPLNTWPLNPMIHTTYVYLPQEEQALFASTPLSYLVRQVTPIYFPQVLNSQLLQLEIHNPLTRLIIIPRRSDSILYKNYITNFTNWWNYPQRPKIDTQVPTDNTYIESQNATGLIVPAGQKDIVSALRLLCDGNEIQESKPSDFFTKITPFRYLDGSQTSELPIYSFELHSPTSQPSGSINLSRIRRIQLDLQVYPLPPNSSYFYSVNVYAETLNFFLVESGMGDVKYAI